MNWTFAYLYLKAEAQIWYTSRMRFATLREAAQQAMDWMVICEDNDYPIAIKLVEVSE